MFSYSQLIPYSLQCDYQFIPRNSATMLNSHLHVKCRSMLEK